MLYSLDGQENKSLPLAAHDYNFFENNLDYFDGSTILPNLTDGLHNLTVYLGCDWEISNQTTSWHEYYSDSQTVYFTIDANALSASSPIPTTSLSPIDSPLSSSTPHPTINSGVELTQTESLPTTLVVTSHSVCGCYWYGIACLL